jgi:tetratricopeptide (TPR) repeat protein
MARRAPAVLVFEDLHWADEGLLDFIEHVADWGRDAPILLLCTARPDLLDRRPEWGSHGNTLTITLPPLTGEETGRLLSLLLDRADVPAGLRETLLVRAEGNPLYAEEFVRMLVERGLLVQQDGGWTIRTDELPVPESVQGIIASRLDALEPDQKALVQAASVIGRTFLADAVAAVASIERGDVDRLLAALHRRGIFRRYRAPIGAEPEYVFHHALVRDVAYGQIPRARRAESHLGAAAWLESFGRPEDHAETAAHHYLAALDNVRAMDGDAASFADRARIALRRAGDRALALNAFGSAARFFGGALELAPPPEERPELLFSYGKALARSATPDEDVLLRARDETLAAGDADRAAEAQVILGELLWSRGRRDDAFAQVAQAVETLAGRPPSYAKAYALGTLAQFRIRADEADAALAAAREAMTIADELALDEARADALMTIGLARVTRGDFGGLDDLERSIAIAEEANSPLAIRGYLNLGSMRANLGDLRRAAELHAQGERLAERFGDATWAGWLEIERLYEHHWRGDRDAALELADHLRARAERGEARRLEIDACLVRGWIALAGGDGAPALADADRALALAREAGDPQNLYPALALRARTLAAAGRYDEAAACADELLGLMREQPSLPSFWILDLAIALVATGRGAELPDAVAGAPSTRWLEAASAYVAGDAAAAADLCVAIGAAPEERYFRAAAAAGGDAYATGAVSSSSSIGSASSTSRR